MLSFALHLIGSVVCISGLSWIATLLGAGHACVTAVAALLFAAAFIAALAYKREAEEAR
jgi:hypothetical protein